MKRLALFSVLIALVIAPEKTFAQYKNLKQNLAVIDFENRTNSPGIGSGAQDIITTALWKSDRFVMVEREKIRDIISEQDFSHSGRVPAEAAIEIGRILGADYILTGGITEAGLIKRANLIISKAVLDARLIDVATTQIVFAETAFGETEGQDLNGAIRTAAENLAAMIADAADKKPWQSTVIKSDKDRIFINAGQEHRLEKGDIFFVYRQGEALIDPSTKLIIGRPLNKIGEIVITELYPKYSAAAVINGTDIKANDIIKKE